jgi:hypothetical protein
VALGRWPTTIGGWKTIEKSDGSMALKYKESVTGDAIWPEILERLQAIFRIPPFGAPTIRAVKKERKHYQLDWTLVQDKGPRFENLVACHLAKWVDFQQDVLGRDVELRYFRDVDVSCCASAERPNCWSSASGATTTSRAGFHI